MTEGCAPAGGGRRGEREREILRERERGGEGGGDQSDRGTVNGNE